MRLNKKSKGGGIGKSFLFIILALIIGAGVYVALVFFERSEPQLALQDELSYVGKKAEFTLTAADDNSGLRSVRFVLVQNGKEHTLLEKDFPRRGYTGQIGPLSVTETIPFNTEEADVENGEAELVVRASDYSLRGFFSGNTGEIRRKVTIDTVAPKLRLLHTERYINRGGSGIVIYQIDGEASRHGADFAGYFHDGFPLEEGKNIFIAYIAVPYNTEAISTSQIVAEDAAGNQSLLPFSPVFKKVEFKRDTINVGDGFLSEKIPEFENFYPEMQGSMKDKYLYTNRTVRKENNEKIYQLCQDPSPERLWSGSFIRMAGANRAGYADHRSYFYKSEEIDKQVHLGMDIASVQRAEVKAANTGKVVFADYLGIYGNMVLLDHGQGVFSLSSHLSSIQVETGDLVESGVIIGTTGKTGMAGGDHLHFSMLINGIFVTPMEWWDSHWIEVTIEAPLDEVRFE